MKKYVINFSLLAFLIMLLIAACTPKVTQQIPEAPAKEETAASASVLDEDLSPCGKFSDATSPSDAETAHVLYRDFLKNKNWTEAFAYWQKAYEMAPAADGKRDYHFLDGIKLYEQKIKTETDTDKRLEYIQNIFDLYTEATKCYPDKASMYKGLKAFKLYYSYRDQATDMEIYQQFKEVIDTEGEETADFVINPFTALMTDLYLAEKIPMTEAQTYAQKISQAIDYGTENCKTSKACDRWDIVEGYAPVRLEEMEGVDGFYDCDYYKNKYLAELEANPDSCELIATVYSRLKWGKCAETDPVLVNLKPQVLKCYPPEPPSSPTVYCKNLLQDGDYKSAISCYEEKAEVSTDTEKKAQYYLTIAKIYYAHLKSFSKARTYARYALDNKPNWGAPRILIGKLYASSGPLCGPGRGFDSQIVTWPAIDEWNKAKRDPEAAAEARKLINRYSQFMPSKEDIFIRNLKVGDTYKVPCWIQQNTTIRTAD